MKKRKTFWFVFSVLSSALTYLSLYFAYEYLSFKYSFTKILNNYTSPWIGSVSKESTDNFFVYTLKNFSLKEGVGLVFIVILVVFTVFSLKKHQKTSHLSIKNIVIFQIIILLLLSIFLSCFSFLI